MSESYHFDQLQHFTAGTVGPKGQRTFFLQFGNAGELVTLKLEKGQVHALGEFLDQLLEDAAPLAPDDVALALDLIDPIEPAWVVSSIGVAHHTDDDTFALLVEEMVEDDAEPATAELRLTPGQVKGFVDRARLLMVSGRPPCQYCGRALDDAEGWCPCFN